MGKFWVMLPTSPKLRTGWRIRSRPPPLSSSCSRRRPQSLPSSSLNVFMFEKEEASSSIPATVKASSPPSTQ